jgi:hypothetical protein
VSFSSTDTNRLVKRQSELPVRERITPTHTQHIYAPTHTTAMERCQRIR